MLRLIQISDLHFGSGEFEGEWLSNAISIINAAAPDVVICTGDLTDQGQRHEFEEALEWLARIEPPLICVPGNHDAKHNGLYFYEKMVGPTRSRLHLPEHDLVILGLRSPKPDIRVGEIGEVQLEWIMDALEREPVSRRVLALHHHLLQVPDAGQKRDVVVDAGDMLALTQVCEVDLVLCGHRHVPHAWVIGETAFLYCGTTSTDKLRAYEPPCFNDIELGADELRVHSVSSLDGARQPLLIRRAGEIEFIRPRQLRLERLCSARQRRNDAMARG